MRFKAFLAVFTILILFVSSVSFGDTEDEMVEKFMKRLEKKHVKKLSWASINFSVNRINRFNDYNTFVSNESNNFSNTNFSWLGEAKAFGFDLGVVFNDRYAWSIGAEYWMKMGETVEGSSLYLPSGTVINNPKSEIKVIGFTTGLQYFFKNHPKITGELDGLALKGGVNVGLYQVSWDLWPEYSYNNLNLSTSLTTDGNITTYKDIAPGIMVSLGADYPTNFLNTVLSFDMGYLYLNFNQVAWYNLQDEEIIATTTGVENDRVDLNFSGIKGKIEIKKYFSW